VTLIGNELVPVSVGVIAVSISIAFFPWIRSIIGFVTHITFASVIEYTYIRHVWLWCIRKRPCAPDGRIRYHTPDALYLSKQDIVQKIYSRKQREEARRYRAKAMVLEMGPEGSEKDHGNDWGCFGGKKRRESGGDSGV